MRRLARWVAFLLASPMGLVASVPYAQPARSPNIHAYVGPAVPLAPAAFADRWRTGIDLGGAWTFAHPSPLTVRVALSNAKFELDIGRLMSAGGLSPSRPYIVLGDGDASLLTLMIDGRCTLFPRHGRIRSYGYLGGGLFHFSHSGVSILDGEGRAVDLGSESRVAFGVSVGAGVEVMIVPALHAFVEGGLVGGFTEGQMTRFVPLHVGVDLR